MCPSSEQRWVETPCRRGCCWTPLGHSGVVGVCACHDELLVAAIVPVAEGVNP